MDFLKQAHRGDIRNSVLFFVPVAPQHRELHLLAHTTLGIESLFTMTSRQNISSGSAFEEQIGYSRAVVTGDWVFISADVAEQADQTMNNIATALESAGASVSDVVRVKYILPDRDDFPKTWPVLKKWFGEVRPAATMVQSALMKDEMKIEIEVTARTGCGKQDK
ncbi:hypothetical protein FSPOR_7421 [Fusarium sporotrichioides]|uniref:Uncharacterized protein n=2 Tax=Fusarium sambucinum species complex TaxID=569360 RepID=A0A395RYH7_FUSSP|nr:hypothetical protein FSPOR_7421 [Fusarium sporotrichioides]